MAAASSLSVLPLAPRRRAARNVEVGGGGGAPRPLRLARLRLRRGRQAQAAAAVAGDAELPLEEAEAAMRVAADDDSVTATVVSALLTLAFVGLSLLTLGVRAWASSSGEILVVLRPGVLLDGRC